MFLDHCNKPKAFVFLLKGGVFFQWTIKLFGRPYFVAYYRVYEIKKYKFFRLGRKEGKFLEGMKPWEPVYISMLLSVTIAKIICS